jgi:hypothetical protein
MCARLPATISPEPKLKPTPNRVDRRPTARSASFPLVLVLIRDPLSNPSPAPTEAAGKTELRKKSMARCGDVVSGEGWPGDLGVSMVWYMPPG